MIPMMDIAKKFATRGAKITIITCPPYATLFSKQIERVNQLGLEFQIQTVKFPSAEVGMPEGWESTDAVTVSQNQHRFAKGLSLLREPVLHILEEHRPDCLVADFFFAWATDVAARLKIPRLTFGGESIIAVCAREVIDLYQPHKGVSSDSETFLVPHLPGEMKLTRNQLADHVRKVETDVLSRGEASEAELKSYGSIFNSFFELEKDYADYYRNVLGRKAWHIGPVSLCNSDTADKVVRGKEASISSHECLRWLDSKRPKSVIYVCFGSMTRFSSQQLVEIAKGLEASQQDFLWIVKEVKNEEQDWLPEGFEERMGGKGLIIRGWAPQVLILDHESVGGFVTHCGWNSTLEGVCAGVPMVTWPMFADQFYNEHLVTQVLGIGIGVGSKLFAVFGVNADFVRRDDIDKAVRRVMAGEEAEVMRRRATALREMARKAVAEGGSSDSDLTSLIEELRQHKAARESK
ncbi:hypothetical protein NL676_015680 [Syzygium grande]|nr:hypothetical protein NL676_015680 [Syzygium grande]